MGTRGLGALLSFLLLGGGSAGCGGAHLGAAAWSQFHADEGNRGFIGIHSPSRLQQKWAVAVGPVTYASPAVDSRGNVYVGNLVGELKAIDGGGNVLWTHAFPNNMVLGTPSVDPDGNIYAIFSADFVAPSGAPRSVLRSFDASGALRWEFDFFADGYTSASTKLWLSPSGPQILVYARTTLGGRLFIVGGQDGSVLNVTDVCGNVIEGRSDLSLTELLTWFFLGFPVTDPFQVQGLSVIDPKAPPDGTVAVVDNPQFTPPGTALLFVANNDCSTTAFEWDGAHLTMRWVTAERGPSRSSVAFGGALVAVGRSDNRLIAYNVGTGKELWSFDTHEPVIGTPAVLGTRIFAPSSTQLQIVDFDGSLVAKLPLRGNTSASPAITLDRVYIGSSWGLVSTSPDFTSFESLPQMTAAYSSPAIGNDGTVYVVTDDGWLRAFLP